MAGTNVSKGGWITIGIVVPVVLAIICYSVYWLRYHRRKEKKVQAVVDEERGPKVGSWDPAVQMREAEQHANQKAQKTGGPGGSGAFLDGQAGKGERTLGYAAGTIERTTGR